MNTTPQDLIASCPLLAWATEHKFTIQLELTDGMTLILRAGLPDLEHFKCDAAFVKQHFANVLQNKTDSVCAAIANNMSQRLVVIAQDQLRIAQLSSSILHEAQDGTIQPGMLILAARLLGAFLDMYQEDAIKAGWPKFLNLCESYANELLDEQEEGEEGEDWKN